jgi:GntR family negative regulator for fad regulon and positive regulator of fabA
MTLERPKEFAVRQLVGMILGGELSPATSLPPERELAEQIGVTRPTLREALQRLVSEGWITIAQGKSTLVNDYRNQGGLGILGSIVQYSEEMPWDMVRGLLELRRLLVPAGAAEAARLSPGVLLDYLECAKDLTGEAEAFVRFDWQLQSLMMVSSGNAILPLMFNDFAALYERIGIPYFSMAVIREETLAYYGRLAEAIGNGGGNVGEIVAEAMSRSEELITTRLELAR